MLENINTDDEKQIYMLFQQIDALKSQNPDMAININDLKLKWSEQHSCTRCN